MTKRRQDPQAVAFLERLKKGLEELSQIPGLKMAAKRALLLIDLDDWPAELWRKFGKVPA